eukprot:TRINITY_DN9137_c0_g1_i1.p2 TRINITY_DN9137_c0_g1~~TRINITY_DN9137_c0_g1_i1.p2  ORF type:complete len:132 (-),score=31.77 TRINITY_DN9137_c0_g1_i1:150-545(-)
MERTLAQEKAFLAWLNSFNIDKEPIKDLTSLKDGVFLMRFLKGIDGDFFTLEGFSLEPNHWSLSVSNVQKLNDSILEYAQKYLLAQFPKDYIDIQAVGRKGDKEEILKLVVWPVNIVRRSARSSCKLQVEG